MALKAVAGGTGRVREGVRTQGGAATPPAPPPAGGGGGGGGGGATATIWNAADMTAGGVLSADNLTFSSAGNGRSVRANQGKSAGKLMISFQVTINQPDILFGLTTSSAAIDNDSYGYTPAMYDWPYGNGVNSKCSENAADVLTGAFPGNNGWIDYLVDFTLGLYWVRSNGVLYAGDPVAGTGGRALPAGLTGVALFPFSRIWSYSATTYSVVMNAGASAPAFAAPSAFVMWDS